MLSDYTRQWVDLRQRYSLKDLLNNDTTERTLPCITHVTILNPIEIMSNETGIILHLIDSDLYYKRMKNYDFYLAKSNCRRLLETYASAFRHEVNQLSSPDMTLGNRGKAIDLQLTEVHKTAH